MGLPLSMVPVDDVQVSSISSQRAAVIMTARRRALHGVDGALGRLAAELLGGALDALGQDVAEALAGG